MSGAGGLRALLRGEAMVIAPGAYDGLTAKLVAQAGFPAVYMTGAGTAVSHGYPDFGLLTMTEMVDNAARIVARGRCAGDRRRRYRLRQRAERRSAPCRNTSGAGSPAIHIEDQVFPKKCGHLDDKEIVPRDDCIAKIRAAAAARRDRDFMIIARTDARAVAGFDEAIGARQRSARGRRRHGVCRGAADDGGGRRGAAAGRRAVPAERRARRQDAGDRPAPRPSAMGYKLAIVPGLLLKAVDRRLRRRCWPN